MEAAVHWAEIRTSGLGGEDRAADDMRAYGSTEDEIQAALGDGKKSDFEIWPENVETLNMFCSLQTQWRVGPMGGYLGLEYPGVWSALKGVVRGRKTRRAMFTDIQAMELAALPVLNARHD